MIGHDGLAHALRDHLPRQRWFAGDGHLVEVRVVSVEPVRREWPALVQVLVEVETEGRHERPTYQVVVGLRPLGARNAFLEGRPEAVIGEIDSELGSAFAYDAAIDPELSICLLNHVAPDEEVERARPLGTDQSNTSVVFDERLILKVFRRLADGPNPDAEVTRALASVGFENVADPIAEWRGDRFDYAVLNEFLVGAADGFHLALTSLRDLYDRRCEPAAAGGDFAYESRRLGTITAQMHLGLAKAFGTTPGDGSAWAADMHAHLARVSLPADVDEERVASVYGRMAALPDVGPALRVHGDYHLGQVMRTDAGWYVLDFEGEPDRPLEERRRPSSPMRDVAGLTRSLHYATQLGLRERGEEVDDELIRLADEWERRNVDAFVDGYLSTEGVDEVLPSDEEARDAVRAAFELDKAIYEIGYEQAHRPDWVDIPRSAVQRLLEHR